jgi:hypothetical protein
MSTLALRVRHHVSPSADRRTKARSAYLLVLTWLTLVAVGWLLVTG